MTQAMCYSTVPANRTSCLTPQPKRRRVLVGCLSLFSQLHLSVPYTFQCAYSSHASLRQTRHPEGSTLPALQRQVRHTVGPSTTSHSISVSFSVMFSSRILPGLPTARFPTDYHATSVNVFLHSTTHLHCPTVKPHGGVGKSRIPTSPSRMSREAPSYHA